MAEDADFVRRTFAGPALRGHSLQDAAQCSKSAGTKSFAVREGVGGRVLGGEANGVLYKIVRTKQKSSESYLLTNKCMVGAASFGSSPSHYKIVHNEEIL